MGFLDINVASVMTRLVRACVCPLCSRHAAQFALVVFVNVHNMMLSTCVKIHAEVSGPVLPPVAEKVSRFYFAPYGASPRRCFCVEPTTIESVCRLLPVVHEREPPLRIPGGTSKKLSPHPYEANAFVQGLSFRKRPAVCWLGVDVSARIQPWALPLPLWKKQRRLSRICEGQAH